MASTIRSRLTDRPVTVPLANGEILRLSPGAVSAELPDDDVAESAKVAKLQQLGMIAVETVSRSKSKPAAGRKAQGTS